MPGSASQHQFFSDIHLYYDAHDATGPRWRDWGNIQVPPSGIDPTDAGVDDGNPLTWGNDQTGYNSFAIWDTRCQ
jgi:hypothetical protein